MNDITWIGEGAADWAAHYGGRVAGAGSAYPPLPGDVIRTAWYMMDGPADRPTTVAECHVFIEQLLAAVGELTGITNAAAIPPWEPPGAGPAYDITSGLPGYTGPALHLTWHNGVGVASADDPRCTVPWVLVPTSC